MFFMKKTLMITLEFPPQVGGVASVAERLADFFPEGSLVVLTPPVSGAEAFDATKSYPIVRRPLYFPRAIWPRWLRAFFLARRIIREEKIEQVIVHHVLPMGLVAYFIRQYLGIPYIVFCHGTDTALATRTPWKQSFFRRVLGSATGVVCNSEALRRRIVSAVPELEKKIMVVYPCPDQRFFDPVPEAIIAPLRSQLSLTGKRVILSVGRLVDGKGFPHLIRMMPEILAMVPDAVLLVIGDGPKRDMLHALADELQVNGAVRFLGEISHDHLPEYFALANLFVLLTHPDGERTEGFGLVYLEAAAARVPVVAGAGGGVEEAVHDGVTGRLVDVYQKASTVQTIADLLLHPEQGETLAVSARNRAEKEFTPEIQFEKVRRWLE